MAEPVIVLFVCVGNCVRSQMAEAIARHRARLIAAESAGLHPLGFIDPTARSVMNERGISMDGQFSKGLHNHALSSPHLTINMSGMPGTICFGDRRSKTGRFRTPSARAWKRIGVSAMISRRGSKSWSSGCGHEMDG